MKSNNTYVSNSCLICKGKKIHYDFSLDKFRVEECADCGLMRLNPQPTDHELEIIYNANYFINLDGGNGQSHSASLKADTADQYLDLLESYVGSPLSGRLLEIGCGQGDFLLDGLCLLRSGLSLMVIQKG